MGGVRPANAVSGKLSSVSAGARSRDTALPRNATLESFCSDPLLRLFIRWLRRARVGKASVGDGLSHRTEGERHREKEDMPVDVTGHCG